MPGTVPAPSPFLGRANPRGAKNARPLEAKLPATRRPGDHLQVIAVTNFKGGSDKTTTAAHVAQYFAMRGFRTLAIDLDPQAHGMPASTLRRHLAVLVDAVLVIRRDSS